MTEPHAQPYVDAGEDVLQSPPALPLPTCQTQMGASAMDGSACHRATESGEDMQKTCESSPCHAKTLVSDQGRQESDETAAQETAVVNMPPTSQPCPMPPASSPEPGQRSQVAGDAGLSFDKVPQPGQNPSNKICQAGEGEMVGRGEEEVEEGGGAWTPPSESPTPPHMRWAKNLELLLDDENGVSLFQTFLEKEQYKFKTLDFVFACNGLQRGRPEQRAKMVQAIHRRLIMQLPPNSLKESTRKDISAKVAAGMLTDVNIFDEARKEIMSLMNCSLYPNFLRSEVYLDYVQGCQNGSEHSSESSHNNSDLELPSSGRLPTLHEDSELTSLAAPQADLPWTLTRDTLLATQDRRALPWMADSRPRLDSYRGHHLHHGHSRVPNPYHTYAPYNTVSRQDSELQSLSSEAPTEEGSANGMPGKHHHCSKSPCKYAQKASKQKPSIIRDPMPVHSFIPRTERMPEKIPMQPEEFAKKVIEKLQQVQKDLEMNKTMARKLQDSDEFGEACHHPQEVTPHVLAAAFKDKLQQVPVEEDQAILDKHVSRVWSETPSRSPGPLSPRPHSPNGRDLRRRSRYPVPPVGKCGGMLGPVPHPTTCYPTERDLISVPYPYHSRAGYSHHRRKEKDVYSTFSSDSGNVCDFQDEQYFHMPKSKSMPDYYEAQKQDMFTSSAGFDASRRTGRDVSRKAVPKKACNDLTDSGVSVVSDTPPSVPFAAASEQKVRYWVMDSEKYTHQHAGSEKDSSKHRSSNATSPNTSRSSRKQAVYSTTPRSSSLERRNLAIAGVAGSVVPGQPLATDTLMPLLPQPDTDTWLVEARRRLEENVRGKVVKPRTCGSKPQHLEVSNPSTLKKSRSGAGPAGFRNVALPPSGASVDTGDYTVVMYNFCDEEMPYRTRLPGKPVTLRQFKELLHKKGNYRYYFKTACDEVDEKVIQEEVREDNEILPLWEGKVFAMVKPVE